MNHISCLVDICVWKFAQSIAMLFRILYTLVSLWRYTQVNTVEALLSLYLAQWERACHQRKTANLAAYFSRPCTSKKRWIASGGHLAFLSAWACAINPRIWHISLHPMICYYNALEICATSRATINVPANRLRDRLWHTKQRHYEWHRGFVKEVIVLWSSRILLCRLWQRRSHWAYFRENV